MPDERDLHELFRRDLDRIALPPAAVWLPGTRTLARSRWRSLLAVSAAASVIVLALALGFAIQVMRGDVATPATSPSPSATVAPSASPSAAPSASPTPSATPSGSALPPSNAVRITDRLPAQGQWALIVTRTWDSSPTEPDRASGPARLPTIDSIRAVPLSARATVPRDTRYLLSFTSQVGNPVECCNNLLREQFSPDGRRLVLSVVSTETADGTARAVLVIVDLVAGTAVRLLSDDAYHDIEPAWSPVGDEIAFARRRVQGVPGSDRDAGLWTVRADGTGLRQVLAGAIVPESTHLHSWNGNGTAIGFTRGFEGAQYQLVDTRTAAVVTVGDPWAQRRAMADWRNAPTAFVGAFMEGPHGGLQYLITADAAGGGARTIVTGTATDGNTFFHQPRWRPGGDDLLYVRSSVDGTVQDAPVEWRLLVTDTSGRGPREVTRVPGGGFVAAWTPDGRDIVYVTGQQVAGAVHLIAPDGTNDRLVQAYGGVGLGRTDWIDLAVLGF